MLVSDCSTDRTAEIAYSLIGATWQRSSYTRGNRGDCKSTGRFLRDRKDDSAAFQRLARQYRRRLHRSANWLSDQIDFASSGIEAVAGIIAVDSFEEHGPEVPARFRASYSIHADGTHPHIHGANLGVRADRYVDVGRVGGLENGRRPRSLGTAQANRRSPALLCPSSGCYERPARRTGSQWLCGRLGGPQRYGSCRMSLAAQFRRLLDDGRLNLPFPGCGDTARRHWELAQIARDNLELGRLVEAHADALAILHEAGREPKPQALYGVWASEGSAGLKLSGRSRLGTERVLYGRRTRRLCSGDGYGARAPSSGDRSSGWLRIVLASTHPNGPRTPSRKLRPRQQSSVTIRFAKQTSWDRPGWYLDRPGFWHGACGPASCWAGGAQGLIDYALKHTRETNLARHGSPGSAGGEPDGSCGRFSRPRAKRSTTISRMSRRRGYALSP